jgi:hypothetical protein
MKFSLIKINIKKFIVHYSKNQFLCLKLKINKNNKENITRFKKETNKILTII